MRPSFLVIISALSAAAPTAHAQRRVTVLGTVRDPAGAPIAYARVDAPGRGQFLADAEGAFRLTAERGNVTIVVRRIGFHPDTSRLRIEGDTMIAIVMRPVATEIGAVAVNATRNDPLARMGFYDRVRDRERGLNNGTFVFPEEIEARRPQRITQMLTKAPGVRLMLAEGAGYIPVTSANCYMTVYLDGARLQTLGTAVGQGTSGPRLYPTEQRNDRAPGDLRSLTLDAIVAANHVAAIEIYPRGANAPQRYQLLNGTCGIIALWTRSGLHEEATSN